jgi:glutamate carboxypeptidase
MSPLVHVRTAVLVLAAFAVPAAATPPGPAPAKAAKAAKDQAAALSRTEQRAVRFVDAHVDEAIALLARVVAINSGTQNVEGVRAVGEVFRRELEDLGFEARLAEPPPETARGPHLIAQRRGTRGRRLLLIGHLDTVFEKDSPFQRWERQGNRAKGPGAVDMKGGDVIVLFALKALHEAGALEGAHIEVVFTGDEEAPGPIEISRRDLIDLARRSDAALGFEATASNLGEATVARRGASAWHLSVKGRAAHSSGIFGERTGAGAVFEAARILKGFYDELSREQYLTFNPGLVLGGSQVAHDFKGIRGTAAGKTNIVASDVEVQGDLRFLSDDQLQRARERMRRIVSEGALPQTSAEITFGDSYPAMEPKPGNYALLAVLDQASRALGSGPVTALDPGRRGAGDVSFVAGHVDCLDGLGAMGSGSHTAEETLDLESLPTLIKRAAVLIHRLTRAPR